MESYPSPCLEWWCIVPLRQTRIYGRDIGCNRQPLFHQPVKLPYADSTDRSHSAVHRSSHAIHRMHGQVRVPQLQILPSNPWRKRVCTNLPKRLRTQRPAIKQDKTKENRSFLLTIGVRRWVRLHALTFHPQNAVSFLLRELASFCTAPQQQENNHGQEGSQRQPPSDTDTMQYRP